MPHLLIGFDSAWTPNNEGAIVATLRHDDGSYEELGPPRSSSFPAAAEQVHAWRSAHRPTTTLILLDQPTIVRNERGQRPVENLVGSPVSHRYGGVQPASTSRTEMFGQGAPLWPFLDRFGGPADPLVPNADTQVIETYPVLALAALGWLRDDARATGRLPKYNPEVRKTFSLKDWQFLCRQLEGAFAERALPGTTQWIRGAAALTSPRKRDQDGLDACLCLLVALHLAEQRECLLVGNVASGYMVVPHSPGLHEELDQRCRRTGRVPHEWVRPFRMR